MRSFNESAVFTPLVSIVQSDDDETGIKSVESSRVVVCEGIPVITIEYEITEPSWRVSERALPWTSVTSAALAGAHINTINIVRNTLIEKNARRKEYGLSPPCKLVCRCFLSKTRHELKFK